MSNHSSGSALLSEAIESALQSHLAGLSREFRQKLFGEVAGLVEKQSRAERDRCVEVCRKRAELWRNTIASRSPSALAREEARARANEAVYLADLLASGDRLVPTSSNADA